MKNKEIYYELETDRLLLRKLTLEDIHDMYDYGSDEEVSKYVMWKKYESIDDAKSFANFVLNKYLEGDNNFWAIENKKNGKMIGTINFVHLKEKHNWSELGYVMNRKYWNKGLMTEAVKTVISHSFETLALNKVVASAIDFNTGSYKVMEKAGMIKEGITREHFIKNDKYYDLVNYSILRSEYSK